MIDLGKIMEMYGKPLKLISPTNEDDFYSTIIIDPELDPIKGEFYNDNCVTLNTKEYSYIILDKETLYELIELIEEVKEICNKQ